jgi:hypothetical protein
MTAVNAVLLTCDYCGTEQIVPAEEMPPGVRLTIRSARLLMKMRGWVRKGSEDYCCLVAECREVADS